jgi:hypothetical protein
MKCQKIRKKTKERKIKRSTKRNGGEGNIVININVSFTDVLHYLSTQTLIASGKTLFIRVFVNQFCLE